MCDINDRFLQKNLRKFKENIVLPVDLAYTENDIRKEAETGNISASVSLMDIGAKTSSAYQKYIHASCTVFVNGPMGIFEEEATEYGITDVISYICAGGDASVRFLTGEELPVVKALRRGANVPERAGI